MASVHKALLGVSNSMCNEIKLPKQGAVQTETQPSPSASGANGDRSLERGASFPALEESSARSPCSELPSLGESQESSNLYKGLAAALSHLHVSVFLQ